MARVPGGPGKQLFGIGRFVPAGFVPDGFFQTPAMANGENVTRLEWVVYDQTSAPVFIPTAAAAAQQPGGSLQSENVARLERVVYDQTSTPVFKPAAVVAAQTLVDAASSIVRRTVVGSLAVFATASAMAEPVFVPPQVTTAAIASSDTAARSRRVRLPDNYTVSFTPSVTLTPIESSDAAIRTRRTNLPDGYVAPVTVPAAAAVAALPYGALGTSCTVVRTSIIIGDQTFTPVFLPAVAAAALPYGALGTSCTVVRTSIIIGDQTSTPVFLPEPSAPVAGRFVSDDALNWTRHQKIKPVPLSAFVFAYPIDDLPPLGTSLTVVRTSITVLDQTSTPVFPPEPPEPPEPVAGRFVPGVPQGGFARSRIKPVQLSAFVFAYPINDDLAQDYTGQFIRSKRNKIVPDGIAQPPVQPPPTISTQLASAHSGAIVVRSRVVYDPVSPAVFKPLTVTPLIVGYQRVDTVLRRQPRKILPDGVVQQFRILAATPSEFGYPNVGAVWRKQPKFISETPSQPPFQTLTVTPADFGYQTVDAVWRKQLKILPDGYATPVTSRASIVGAPAGFGYQTVGAVWRKQFKVLPDGLVKPAFRPLTATPSDFGYQTVDAVWRKYRKVRADDGFVRPLILPPPSPVVPPGAVTGGGGLGFSYQRYERLLEELYKKKKKAPSKAKKALAKAIAVVEKVDTRAEDLARLLQALEAAAAISTQNTLAAINAANAVAEQARAILEQQRLQRLREEDDLILLMLEEDD